MNITSSATPEMLSKHMCSLQTPSLQEAKPDSLHVPVCFPLAACTSKSSGVSPVGGDSVSDFSTSKSDQLGRQLPQCLLGLGPQLWLLLLQDQLQVQDQLLLLHLAQISAILRW